MGRGSSVAFRALRPAAKLKALDEFWQTDAEGLRQFGRTEAEGADEGHDECGPKDQGRFKRQTGTQRNQRAQGNREEPKERLTP